MAKTKKEIVRWVAVRALAVVTSALLLVAIVEVTLSVLAWVAEGQFRRSIRPVDLRGETTVVCIGDSFTYGMGAPEGHSYPDYLQRRFDADRPGEVRVVNLGRGGSNSSQAVIALETFLARGEDAGHIIVLALTGLNNVWNLADASFWDLDPDQIPATIRNHKPFLQFRTHQLLAVLAHRFDEKPDSVEQWKRRDDAFYRRRSGEKIGAIDTGNSEERDFARTWFEIDFLRLLEICRARGIELVAMTYPTDEGDLRDDHYSLARVHGLPFIDLADVWESGGRADFAVEDGFHFNANGYEHVADVIYKRLGEFAVFHESRDTD